MFRTAVTALRDELVLSGLRRWLKEAASITTTASELAYGIGYELPHAGETSQACALVGSVLKQTSGIFAHTANSIPTPRHPGLTPLAQRLINRGVSRVELHKAADHAEKLAKRLRMDAVHAGSELPNEYAT
ncbi:hypothetical protein [Corallococcus sp. AB038B]|uniref:hypothetical protein n=1 Tax=Corallococcus sp. AB038B TaxID=2316718 RepID=UPI000EECC798|nr:hypothetical protein [Corallococcus sp. AB038B]RKH92789.1 hypothetical protein D7Y04_42355 [Corallococcus sp. AB038B]